MWYTARTPIRLGHQTAPIQRSSKHLAQDVIPSSHLFSLNVTYHKLALSPKIQMAPSHYCLPNENLTPVCVISSAKVTMLHSIFKGCWESKLLVTILGNRTQKYGLCWTQEGDSTAARQPKSKAIVHRLSIMFPSHPRLHNKSPAGTYLPFRDIALLREKLGRYESPDAEWG